MAESKPESGVAATSVVPSAPPSSAGKQGLLALSAMALGVVFGDIGTSPIYTFEACMGSIPARSTEDILGLVSMVLWVLIFIVTFKYVAVVMREDYRGEGGVFALLALVEKAAQNRKTHSTLFFSLIVFGAALLYGDGTITPAISVLSAIEGLETVDPQLGGYEVPITCVILGALFSVQRFGTGRLGSVFGGVMMLWFVAIGIMGIGGILTHPGILAAVNPYWAIRLVAEYGLGTLPVMGAVVLAVTGAEALYSDLGHFGRRPIATAWHALVLPGLVLNYLGQGALALSSEAFRHSDNPFFLMVPPGALRLGMVILATAATVIASQSLIAGVFSLTHQAMQLGYFPRVSVVYTSSRNPGQVYIPTINFVLGFVCIMLVIAFRKSDNLASAYGLAVTGTMLITSLAYGRLKSLRWGLPAGAGLLISCIFLIVEFPLFLACLTKLFSGGYFPVVLALGVLALMQTWKRGQEFIGESTASGIDLADFAASLETKAPQRVPGSLVFVTSDPSGGRGAAVVAEYLRRTQVLSERIVILTLLVEPERSGEETVSAREIGRNFWHITAEHGYQMQPDAPAILRKTEEMTGGKFAADPEPTFYVLSRKVVAAHSGDRLLGWQTAVVNFLSRNEPHSLEYFNIPAKQIVEFTWALRV